MTELLKPGETPLESKIEELLKIVQTQGQLLGLMDQYMLMNKRFFDQIKINTPPQQTVAPVVAQAPIEKPKEK